LGDDVEEVEGPSTGKARSDPKKRKLSKAKGKNKYGQPQVGVST
jgi:hypothetical protein